MKMKLNNINDIDKFFDVVRQCDDAVELTTPEGSRINLKSKLSQYFSMASIFSGGTIRELNLTTHNPKDSERLIRYMFQGC